MKIYIRDVLNLAKTSFEKNHTFVLSFPTIQDRKKFTQDILIILASPEELSKLCSVQHKLLVFWYDNIVRSLNQYEQRN